MGAKIILGPENYFEKNCGSKKILIQKKMLGLKKIVGMKGNLLKLF